MGARCRRAAYAFRISTTSMAELASYTPKRAPGYRPRRSRAAPLRHKLAQFTRRRLRHFAKPGGDARRPPIWRTAQHIHRRPPRASLVAPWRRLLAPHRPPPLFKNKQTPSHHWCVCLTSNMPKNLPKKRAVKSGVWGWCMGLMWRGLWLCGRGEEKGGGNGGERYRRGRRGTRRGVDEWRKSGRNRTVGVTAL